MKKLFLLAVLFFIAAVFKIQAQDLPGWDGKTYKYGTVYPGYIVKLTGDTIQGFILLKGPTENQDKITYLPTERDMKNKTVYKPDDLKGFRVADKEYRSIHYSGGLFAKPLRFVMVNADGKLCRYYWYSTNDATRKIESQEVFAKGDEQPFTSDKYLLKFVKFWSETLNDYPELSQKIANKEKGYSLLNLYDIITEYNNHFSK